MAEKDLRPQKPVVSIVVPIYNASRYLKDCLESILSQTFKSFEVLLVDDGSTDSSGEIADQFARRDERIVVFHKSNKGVSHARNFGLSHASGEYITFVDSDDFLTGDYLKELVDMMTPEIDFCYGNMEMLSDNGSLFYQTFQPGKTVQETLSNLFSCGWMFSIGILFRKGFLLDHQLFFPEHINYTEDVWFTARAVFFADNIKKTEHALYQYNAQNSGSITHQSHNEVAERVRLTSMSETIAFLQDNDAFKECRQSCYWRILVWKSWMALHPDKYAEFNSSFSEANAYINSNPFLSGKMKVMLWFIAHRLYLPAKIMLRIYER